jgi:hypothetical protein
MTDLQQEIAQQEIAQQGKRGWPVEAWDAIAALYNKHVAPT